MIFERQAKERAVSKPVLIIPGIGNSGPEHWQSRWESAEAGFVRVHQRDWDHPVCAEWVAAIESAVRSAGPAAVLVAHSLGCLALAHWAVSAHSPLRAALLVAVPDPAGANFPPVAIGFAEPPMQPLGFASTVVVSTDDPYGSAEQSARLAQVWGSRLVNIGACGHINAASGLGDWAFGRALLTDLQA